jgi:hypothetical protein
LENARAGEEATHATPKKAAKNKRIALAGAKKGAAAARKSAAVAKKTMGKIVKAPAIVLDKTIYGACYGISYGAVFTSLMIEKALPTDSVAMKGFHEGAEIARKDFESRREKHLSPEDPPVVS